MIVKIGIVRDGQIVESHFYGSHEHLIQAMFSGKDMERIVETYKRAGPAGAGVLMPRSMCTDSGRDQVQRFSQEGWSAYINALPDRENPLKEHRIMLP